MNESDDILSGSLGRLPREMTPPESLEDRTVASLRSAGLIQASSRSGITLASWVLAASIGAIAFVGGSVISKQKQQEPQPMFELTLLQGQIDDSAASASRAAEYEAWASAAHASPARQYAGATISGGEGGISLSRAIGNSDSVIVDDMIAGPTKGFATKYYISAPSQDSALKIAKACPHLKYGGKIVLQRLGENGK